MAVTGLEIIAPAVVDLDFVWRLCATNVTPDADTSGSCTLLCGIGLQ
jgi:hypothetical protein